MDFSRIVDAPNAYELSRNINQWLRRENLCLNFCTSIHYSSEGEQNSNYTVAIVNFNTQTCIHFEQVVRFVEANNIEELTEKMKKVAEEMYRKEKFICTCMQTQSDCLAHISRSTALMLFTKQYL